MFDKTVTHTVETAQAAMLRQINPLGQREQVALTAALGRVLARDYYAEAAIPAFANSAMDGYAVQAADLEGLTTDQPVHLQVLEHLGAGKRAEQPVRAGTAMRIMTGAPIPEGADTVVPFEHTDEIDAPEQTRAQVEIRVAHERGAHIRSAGEDLAAGTRALSAGTMIHPGTVAVLATLGMATVEVFKRPRIAILATGDELVDIEQTPTAAQIRNSNSYALYAQILEAGGEPLLLPIAQDNETAFLERIEQAKQLEADLLISSGGVSVGDHDVVRHVLTTHGKVELWKVRMRPGKPVMFGFMGETPLLGLPGNPVSAMVCFELFGRPLIHTLAGTYRVLRQPIIATLTGAAIKRVARRQYLRVYVQVTPSGVQALPTGAQGSGIITSMAQANGLLIIEEGTGVVQTGEQLPVLLLHDLLPASF